MAKTTKPLRLAKRNRVEVEARQITGLVEEESGVYARLMQEENTAIIDVRFFYWNLKDQRYGPTLRGVTLSMQQAEQLRAALVDLLELARERGLE